ncbi:DUF4832 domain-containing protein [Chroococcidiopsis sp. CCNUC1]|uniref:DUF4832 domain-containing protein n=1 Tax=Chroococcidiopsis sp. CCNUC1 TaxID=2653189 RepID=UPI0020221A81|nr:DUF4832 domain-containing protein [Chroococcidiopsis sp. CCNUC1]URD52531.1 DUF4832 domain-containing protein [Chroococcidiopsis sp. CCNUC1]
MTTAIERKRRGKVNQLTKKTLILFNCLISILIIIYFTSTCKNLLGTTQSIDLTESWDSEKVLKNPHKGWYHHYFDNGLWEYGTKSDSDLENFPGMNHLYLRLAWSYLEPQAGKFNWSVIDNVINKWTMKGYSISFCITAKETNMVYATPEWVKKAGAKGAYYDAWGVNAWEPDYGDPIFLAKLENFHKAFAARYAGKPWLEYITIGSYGDWGEGHTSFSSRRYFPIDVLKKHIDIYKKYYLKSTLVIADGWVNDRRDNNGSQLQDYILQNKITFRDDSVNVSYYVDTFPSTYSVQSPELFNEVFRHRPTILELQHYHLQKKDNDWIGVDGSIKGGELLKGAIDISHATFVGYHGYADEWLKENPTLARKLANKMGYWYFLKSIEIPSSLMRGSRHSFKLKWENHGVAPAYYRYKLKLALKGTNGTYTQYLTESNNKSWLPGTTVAETYSVNVPQTLAAGEYKVAIALVEERNKTKRPIELALKDELKGNDDFYEIGYINIE